MTILIESLIFDKIYVQNEKAIAMQSKSKILEFLKTNKISLEKNYHIQKIGLFGSYARCYSNETN